MVVAGHQATDQLMSGSRPPPVQDPRPVLWTAIVAVALAGGAALALGNIYADSRWLVPVAVAVVGAVGLAMVARWLRIPTVATVVASLLIGTAWLAAWWPPAVGLAWAQRLSALRAGVDLANQEVMTQVAPAPTLSGLLLLSVAGAFVTALAVTVLLQHGAVLKAILVALVLWVVPLSVPVPDGQVLGPTMLLLAPAALALATIGRDDEPSTPIATRAIAGASALLLALVAAPVAAALPWYDAPPMVDLQDLGTTLDAAQPVVDVGDQLHQPDPRPVMSVRTSTPTYLRTAALEVFDGVTWRIGNDIDQTEVPTDHEVNPRDGIPGPRPDGTVGRWDVTSLSLQSSFLPIVNQPTRVAAAANATAPPLRFNPVGDHVTVDSLDALEHSTAAGPDYVVDAVIPTPTVAELAATGVDPAPAQHLVDLPPGQDPLVDQAHAIVDQAGADTAIDQVLALQDHFAGDDSDFTYSTDVPNLRGFDALRRFALEDQTGYCEYYATAMAVMLRGLGIPTRVATGYLPGDEVAAPTPDSPGIYQVSSSDAHAWVEVAFADHGWVTFDPTPRSDTTQLRSSRTSLVNLVPTGRGDGPDVAPGDDLRAFDTAPPIPPVADVDPAAAAPDMAGTNNRPIGVMAIAGLAMVAIAAAVLLVRRRRHRGRNDTGPAGRVLAAQARMLATADRLGAGRHDDETMHELAHRWVRAHYLDQTAAEAVAQVSSQAAFAGLGAVTDEDATMMERAATVLTGQLTDQASRGRRLFERVRSAVDP